MKGPRVSDLLALCCVLLAGFLLFVTSQGVQSLERQRAHLMHQKQTLLDDLRLLEVEWTLLNRPDRLAALAVTELDRRPDHHDSTPKHQAAMTISDEPTLQPATFVPEAVKPRSHAP